MKMGNVSVNNDQDEVQEGSDKMGVGEAQK